MSGDYETLEINQPKISYFKERLKEHRISIYQGVTYYLGKKGGLYYRSSKGTRIYI